MVEKENPNTVDDIDLSDVDMKFYSRIRDMLRKLENMWNGRLGHLNIAKLAVDLSKGAKPFKSSPYHSGPAAWKFEASEL